MSDVSTREILDWIDEDILYLSAAKDGVLKKDLDIKKAIRARLLAAEKMREALEKFSTLCKYSVSSEINKDCFAWRPVKADTLEFLDEIFNKALAAYREAGGKK